MKTVTSIIVLATAALATCASADYGYFQGYDYSEVFTSSPAISETITSGAYALAGNYAYGDAGTYEDGYGSASGGYAGPGYAYSVAYGEAYTFGAGTASSSTGYAEYLTFTNDTGMDQSVTVDTEGYLYAYAAGSDSGAQAYAGVYDFATGNIVYESIYNFSGAGGSYGSQNSGYYFEDSPEYQAYFFYGSLTADLAPYQTDTLEVYGSGYAYSTQTTPGPAAALVFLAALSRRRRKA
jgi:hypothetical protein